MAKGSGGSRMAAPGGVSGGISASSLTTSLERKGSMKIAQILTDMHNGVKWTRPPFAIGFMDKEIETYCMERGLPYSSKFLYFVSERIQHSQRDSKVNTPVFAPDADLIAFPTTRHSMEIYYDTNKKNFIYTDGRNKYVVEMNYDIRISRKQTKKVNFITMDKLTNPRVFVQNPDIYKKVR